MSVVRVMRPRREASSSAIRDEGNVSDDMLEPLLKKACAGSGRKTLDFSKTTYRADSHRITGVTKQWCFELATTVGVQEDKLDLWYSYCFFLLHIINLQTGPFLVGSQRGLEGDIGQLWHNFDAS